MPNNAQFPLGAAVTLEELIRDPYPLYARLQRAEPVTWVSTLGMWYVTRYEDVRSILMDSDRFTTAFDDSLICDTFGSHMLTTEGPEHDRYRRAVQQTFTPGSIRKTFESAIDSVAQRLIAGFKSEGEADLRTVFAARLPIQAILTVFGMSSDIEQAMRHWYDSFEGALANFTRDPQVRRLARENVAKFHAFIGDMMLRVSDGERGLLATLVNAPPPLRLSDDEIKRNASIIFFGGISTVEALILNSLWALFTHPETLARVRADLGLLPRVLDEAIRWLSPVQSATRHVKIDTVYCGVELSAGDTLNCMLGAANRDPAMFAEPEKFLVDRCNANRHIGFATGPHTCLGFHLAKTEARLALARLLTDLPGLELVRDEVARPVGYEFRQPRAMHVRWKT
jgi:cytochrome P450